jgi:Circadian oscillating protein COP23
MLLQVSELGLFGKRVGRMSIASISIISTIAGVSIVNVGSTHAANPNASAIQAQLPNVSQEKPADPNPAPAETDELRFSCELSDGRYTVMYHPQSQPNGAYPWATPSELGGGWTPERRCNEIARRLEFYRSDGLIELGTTVENGYDIVCVTTEADSRCRIVLTVPPGQDPQQTRDLVFENIVTADRGQSTEAVTTFDRNGNEIDLLEGVLGAEFPETTRTGIDLRPFLDPADGGTGEMLQDSADVPNPRLNPGNFR